MTVLFRVILFNKYYNNNISIKVRFKLSNSTIISEPLDPHINKTLITLFEKVNLINVLNNKVWIAGGFSRIVGNCNFNICNKPFEESLSEYLYKNDGDVDLFTLSRENLKNSMSLIHPYCHEIFEEVLSSEVFSKTFTFDMTNNNQFQDLVSMHNNNRIKIQFVSKFFYKNIEECLSSFDFTNCKFAIELNDNVFYIHYDKEALLYEKKGMLNLEHCNSPLLAKRIIKYVKNKGLILYESKRNKSILSEYYCKVITKSWDSVFFDNMEISNFDVERLGINYLEKIINISQEDLILFIGKLSITNVEYCNQDYGHYVVTGESDWASKLIVEKNNVSSHRKR